MRAFKQPEPMNPLDDVLRFHRSEIQRQLLQAVGDNPVGFVIDCTDEVGRVVGTSLLSESKCVTPQQVDAEFDALIAANRRPVVTFADDGQYAEGLLQMLAEMNPAARRVFEQLRYHRPDNEYLVVVISAGMFGCY